MRRSLAGQYTFVNRRLRRHWRRASRSTLVFAAAMGVCLATWRLRAAPARAAGFVGDTPVPVPTPLAETPRPSETPAPAPEQVLAAVRRRALHGDPRTPATAVDRWILRLATEPEMRAWMGDALARMGRYEPLIRETLRRTGQPEDLLFVAVIESQFRPGAVSSAGATGVWQFMAATGRQYELEISEYVDERRDPIRSTDAAARHLRDLHAEFGGWHLALAAYNAGSGRVSRTVRRHGGGERGGEMMYWRVRPHLPRETQRYVPLFLAAAEIARDPEAFGFRVRRDEPLRFSETWVPGGVSLDAVARSLGVRIGVLRDLNPHLIRGETPPGRAWPVRVPVSTAPPRPNRSPI